MNKNAILLAEQELEDFLEEYPDLYELQRDVDRLLQGCGDDPMKRLESIFKVIKEVLNEELRPNLDKLNEISKGLQVKKPKPSSLKIVS